MIIGHQKQLEILQAARQNGRLSHAYILSGPSKIGKKPLLLSGCRKFWARALARRPLIRILLLSRRLPIQKPANWRPRLRWLKSAT